MSVVQLLATAALLLICVKGDNSNGTCDNDDAMLRNILSINLTIADQKTEICSLKTRIERIERLHGLAPSTDVQQIDATLDQYHHIMKKLFHRRITDVAFKEIRKLNESYHNTTAGALCTEDWQHFQGQCYFFSKDKHSWDDANTSCAAMDSRLAIADNEQINSFIRNDKNRFVRYWIGGKEEGKMWMWAGTGNPLSYTAWCPEQPDGSGTLCVSFLKLVPPTCYWTDRKCKYRQAYICQRPIENITGRGNG
ncbi:C-type lectin domain family 4 member M-like [Mizuhopecten yessoensis]|uniref:CD209 antigen-like protein E n=1 Tax=Mizuhopecten yessoensis TaxID=6573 RepID=A0A210PTL1_MIZYE|nr:C-type lectin domain family 4 member M-like [Mizuhopecten yessoensis]OWF39795.1 CD209 antigen-like protein E [Mizuhopecten yessoensis]